MRMSVRMDREVLVKLLNGTAIPAPGLYPTEHPVFGEPKNRLYLRSVPGFSAPTAFHYPKPEE